MSRAFFVIVVFSSLLVSCTQRLVCPAYQSAYIHDRDQVRKKFSYFVGDSTPKVYAASKTKFLIAEPTTYKKKVRSLQTVPMKRVIPVVPDSLKEHGADSLNSMLDLSGVERNVNDSTAVLRIDTLATDPQDSIYVISKDREVRVLKYKPMERKYYVDTVGFNSEQDTYMWYLRDVLLLPDAKLAQQQQEDTKGEASGAKKKKGIKGFFQNLFKKKDKTKLPQDSTQNIAPVAEEDYGYDDFEGKAKDSTEVESQVQPQSQSPIKQKKGFFSRAKKDKPAKKVEAAPAKKEDTDDGF